jgi:hypothetical protein
MLSVFDLDPVLLPTTAVPPVAMLGNQTLKANPLARAPIGAES